MRTLCTGWMRLGTGLAAVGLVLALMLHSPMPAAAEVKVLEADSAYLMGDNDRKVDARRIAMQEAKRKALEMAGTYIASLTQVKDFRLTRDEVTSFTAGVIETDVLAEEMRGTAQRPEIFIRVRCTVDTSVMLSQLKDYREHDDLKAQLDAAMRETEALRKERDRILANMRSEQDTGKAEEMRKQVGAVLSREEANEETMRYWRRLAARVWDPDQPVDEAYLAEATANLKRIAKEDPRNGRARFLLASIYQRAGDYEAAEREVRGALESSPDDPFLHLKLGALLKMDRKYDAALRELLQAQKGLGDHPFVLFHLATTYLRLDDCAKAADYATQFLERIKRKDKPVTDQMRKRAHQVLTDCGSGGSGAPREGR